ncbi:MAG: excinuclease ABC subunit UvrA [Gemmatimonadales bacterium]
MSSDNLVVENARQNNLRGITVTIPHRSLTVITGPSGSGKSSLAFDTIYAEGQRRYVESLSTYAKQFLERMSKPQVGRIEGISPAVAIEQRNPTTSSRSTVGTATEVQDYLRLLWARIGRPLCTACGAPIAKESPTTAADKVLSELEGEAIMVAFVPPRSDHELMLDNLVSMGFARILHRGRPFRLDELPPQVRLDDPPTLVVVDRLKATARNRERIADSIATAFAEGEGVAEVSGDPPMRFTEHPVCTRCERPSVRLTPSLFSFNNPHGACETCNGFGAVLEYDESLIVPDPNRSIDSGAIDPWTKPRYVGRRRILKSIADELEIPRDVPWSTLSPEHRQFLINGKKGRFVGAKPFLRGLERKRYKQYIRVFLRQYQLAVRCDECGGARLRREALSVRVAGTHIADAARMTPHGLIAWLEAAELSEFERAISKSIIAEITSRARFLVDVGLGYLTFDRQTRSLSGGEAQRISLANALGANLVDTLYVLDEPTIGLHPRDTERLVSLLERLRTAGNTVVVVEHDLDTIRRADYIVELGPRSGEHGGDLIYQGPVAQIPSDSATGSFLTGSARVEIPGSRRTGSRKLALRDASLHNIRSLDVDIPLATLTTVTGVSGSGKSTLVHDILYRQLAARLKGAHGAKEYLGEAVGSVSDLRGWQHLDDVYLIDQSPIGRSRRSNPVTYIKGFDEIRQLFSQQPLSQSRGYTPTTFSFNAARGGRCKQCDGAGHVQVEMVFMADVYVPCERCEGTRYEREVLDVTIKGYNVAQVLQFTVDSAVKRFRHQGRLAKALWHLQQVGLGYLRLGQPATTLSGGEAQRLKIARHLATVARGGRRLYLLDEPTTGLHPCDVEVLIKVLDRLVESGHTVVIIEHNLDVIKRADWVIDLGPEGGPDGGRIVAQGTPEQVAATNTYTGRHLKRALEGIAGDREALTS